MYVCVRLCPIFRIIISQKKKSVRECLTELRINSNQILPIDLSSANGEEEEKFGLYPEVNYLPLELFDDEEYDTRYCKGIDNTIIFLVPKYNNNNTINY